MVHRSYLPTSEPALIIFLGVLIAKLALHAMAIGVTDEQLKLIQRDLAYCLWIMQYWNPAIQQYALEATIYKNMIMNGADPLTYPLPVLPNFDQAPEACPPGALIRLANLIQRIKLSDGYTDAIGQDLGIISSQDTTAHPITEPPGVRLVVASKNLTLRCGGNSGITLFRSIYRAGVIQGIFAWRADGEVGRDRFERQLSYGKELDEKKRSGLRRVACKREAAARLDA